MGTVQRPRDSRGAVGHHAVGAAHDVDRRPGRALLVLPGDD